MPIMTPIIAPIIGPIYGMTFIIPARKPIKIAFLIPRIESPVLTTIVIILI